MAEILVANNPALEGDSEKVKDAKQMVELAKKELRQYVLEGGDVKDFLQYYHGQLVDAHKEWTATQRTVMKAIHEDPDAAPVLIDDLQIVGGPVGARVIQVMNSSDVRIRNCEFSGWGMPNGPDWDRGGQLPNWQSAILIGTGSSEVVVERCYAHDPVSRANSWRYSHPSGVEAVLMGEPDHSCVVRHCDFVGSDLHRFNDAIEGCNNGHMEGGFNRDGDAQGNFLAFANDDCIELDGGQQNVRAFGNRFEGALSGVSVQCCNAGPGYVVDNLFCEMGEEFGCANPSIKTAGIDLRCYGPPVYLCDNVFFGRGGGIETYAKLARFTVERNVFCKGQRLIVPAGNRVADNRTDVAMDVAELDAAYPKRPLAFTLTTAMIKDVRTDGTTVAPASIGFAAVHDGRGKDVRFHVRQNAAFDWFEVSPVEGTIAKGGRVDFTLRFIPEKMRGRRFFRGAFLVRTPGGLSRPVTVYAENPDFVQPFDVPAESAVEQVKLPTTVLDASVSTNALEVAFDVPKDGRYHFLLYGRGTRRWPGDGGWKRDHVRIQTAIDDGALAGVGLQADVFDAWMVATPGCGGFGGTKKRVELKKGRHVLKIVPTTGTLTISGAAVAEDPGPFEPR